MRPINLRSKASMLFAVLATIVLCSFAPGGYNYEMYLNNRLVMQEYLYGRKEAPTVPLTTTSAQDELSIMFNNCNRLDTSRKISLKTGDDKTLKEWTFADSPTLRDKMNIKVTEITVFRNNYSTAKLMYSSKQVIDAVHLVDVQLLDATALKK